MFENYLALLLLMANLWKEGYLESFFTVGGHKGSWDHDLKWYNLDVDFVISNDPKHTARIVYATEDGYWIEDERYSVMHEWEKCPKYTLRKVAEYIIKKSEESA